MGLYTWRERHTHERERASACTQPESNSRRQDRTGLLRPPLVWYMFQSGLCSRQTPLGRVLSLPRPHALFSSFTRRRPYGRVLIAAAPGLVAYRSRRRAQPVGVPFTRSCRHPSLSGRPSRRPYYPVSRFTASSSSTISVGQGCSRDRAPATSPATTARAAATCSAFTVTADPAADAATSSSQWKPRELFARRRRRKRIRQRRIPSAMKVVNPPGGGGEGGARRLSVSPANVERRP